MKEKKEIFPDNEKDRLSELINYEILDTASEKEFDDLVHLVGDICQTPFALISLIDKERQWVKAIKGPVEIREIPRSVSFCQYTILQKDILEVQDASFHPDFRDSPLVNGKAGVKYYAGAPLVTDEGYAIGTICVIDQKPNQLTAHQKNTLRVFARQIVNVLELRRQKLHLEKERNIFKEGLRKSKLNLFSEYKVLSSILNEIPHPVYLKNRDGKFVFVNDAQAKLYNLSPSKILGRSDSDLIENSEALETILKSDEETWKGNGAVELTGQYFFGHLGAVYTLNTTKILIEKGFNDSPYLLGVSVDISKEKSVEKALTQSRNDYESLAENSLDVIARLGRNAQHLYINKTVEGQLGIPAADFLGKTHRQMGFPSEFCNKLEECVRQVFEKGIVKSRCFSFNTFKCRKYYHAVLKPEFDSDMRVISCLVTVRDLTEQKETEEKFRKAFNEIKTFLYKTSHVLKGPVASIKGLTNLGKFEVPDIPYWYKILDVEKQLSQTLKKLSDVHSLKDNKRRSVSVNFRSAVLDAVAKVEISTGQKVLSRISSNIDPSETIYCDPYLLDVILTNTIENSIVNSEKHSPVIVNVFNRDNTFLIEIEDQGIGMDEDVSEKAFEMFYKGNNSSTGAGLGLYLVKLAVENLNGNVFIKSKEGAGTVVTFYIPNKGKKVFVEENYMAVIS